MASFDEAVAVVLANEGGYVNNPDDAGGETAWGISKKQYPDVDIKNLSETSAKIIYFRDYWQPFGFQQVTSQAVATKVFDLAVNIGPVPAVRILQQALGFVLAAPIVADGKLGPLTASMASQVSDDNILPELCARACAYHAKLNQPTFLLGWMRRDVK